ncbi:uncharacterized protein LOC123209823 isoform X4 [Mangifera indica]|uniref:uncharacterized protein LOC123209823 isoform X4 n=1 Tax=Mangifera indica TaxID=29780 RepID=UPI001CFAC3BD|nr:uncharacterized protein LOC123209823 isoform X4 [Mangifera indica]
MTDPQLLCGYLGNLAAAKPYLVASSALTASPSQAFPTLILLVRLQLISISNSNSGVLKSRQTHLWLHQSASTAYTLCSVSGLVASCIRILPSSSSVVCMTDPQLLCGF